MKRLPFDRSKHVYRNDAFSELVKDAVRFFNGTPVQNLPPTTRFTGTGVYAIYYTGGFSLYQKYAELNRLEYQAPIYVGKAVPKGWRQSRTDNTSGKESSELFTRLTQHARNIDAVKGLHIDDFTCRFVIFEDAGSDMISTVEAALIKIKTPLWNSTLDGFGNHDPGKGRYEQARSHWDVIHPGRSFAEKCNGKHTPKSAIIKFVKEHFLKFSKE
jgi:hypothetical protein